MISRTSLHPGVADTRLVDPAGDLAHFYDALERTERRKAGRDHAHRALRRFATTADMITGDVRQLLQQRFGNAGHGFSLMAKPWAWYEHRDVGLRGTGWDNDCRDSRPGKNDGLFGLGGVSFQTLAATPPAGWL